MYTFLFASQIDEERSSDFFEKISDVVTHTMPHAKNEEYLEAVHKIPEIKGGWYWRMPAVLHDRGLITEWSNEDIEVLAVGKPSRATRPLARSVGRLWVQDGIDAVRALEASFSAIIVDKKRSSVFSVSDLIAHHANLFFSKGDSVFISPHVLTLVATGELEVDYDWISIASSVAVDWSLQSRPLLKGVSACRPWEYLKADARGIAVIKNHPLTETFENRLQPDDAAGIQQLRSECVDLMLEHAADWSSAPGDLFVDISAGADSRGTFALAVAAKGAADIVATTIGEEHSHDRIMGHRIASLVGCREQAGSPSEIQSASLKEFYDVCDQRAFLQNGDSDARMALFSNINLSNTKLKVIGNGGEIFRGYYYSKVPYEYKSIESWRALSFVADKLSTPLSNQLAWSSNEWMMGVRARALESIEDFASVSPNLYDVLDLFYLYERLSRWGNIVSIAPWNGNVVSPYVSPQLIKNAYRLPSPIGALSRLPATLVKSLFPQAYWLPVNGRYYFEFEGSGYLNKALRLLTRARFRASNKTSFVAPKGSARFDHNKVRANLLGNMLNDELREMITNHGSIASKLFGNESVEAMVEAISLGDNRLSLCFGHVVTVERWHRMIETARKLSRK